MKMGSPVLHPADDNTLADRHYVTLILRLTLDRRGRLIQGELVDTTDSRPARFIGVVGLNQAVQDWLERCEHDTMQE
jgi:hypothetical protein